MPSEHVNASTTATQGQGLALAQPDLQAPSLPNQGTKPKGAASAVHKQQGLCTAVKKCVTGPNPQHRQAQHCQQVAAKHAQHGTTISPGARAAVSVRQDRVPDAQQCLLQLRGRAGEKQGKLTQLVSAAQLNQPGQFELTPVRGTTANIKQASSNAGQVCAVRSPGHGQVPSRQVSASAAGSKRPSEAPIEDVSKRHKVCSSA